MLKRGLFKKPKNTLENSQASACQIDGAARAIVCAHCGQRSEAEQMEQSLWVCSRCGHHHRIGARKRLGYLTDANSFTELFDHIIPGDPLEFPGYAQRLAQAQADSCEKEAVICGTAAIHGLPCALFAMDPFFMMGSMGTVVGEKITALFEYALDRRLPVVGMILSGGARMQEGILSLMQMAKTSGALARHSEAGLLYTALLCDATTGGVTASFAMLADIILAEPGALIAFAGPRVIEQTLRKKLPQGFQRAEFLLERGFVDRIVPRADQRTLLGALLGLHTSAAKEATS